MKILISPNEKLNFEWTEWLFATPWIVAHQARILEQVAIPSFSKWSSRPRDQTWVSWIAGHLLTSEPPKGTKLLFSGYLSFPGGSDSKESTCQCRRFGLIPGSGRSPGEGNGHPLQYYCLENPMNRGVWQAKVHGVQSDTSQTWLND